MDQWQVLRQFEFKLTNLVWPGTNNKVFGTVVVAQDIPDVAISRTPAIAVAEGIFDCHEEWAELGWFSIVLRIYVESFGDRRGRGALMGHGRQAGTSKGAGLKQIATPLLDLVKRLGPADGIQHIAFANSIQPAQPGYQGNQKIMVGELPIEAFIADVQDFDPPAAFAAAPGVSPGQIDLTFTQPPARFDRVGVHIRRATGSAPATPSDGTAVYTGAATSFTDTGRSPGVTYYYSCWGAYDADYQGNDGGASTADTYSSDATKLTASATAP